MTLQAFHPYESLAERLLPFAGDEADGSHDRAHITRVFGNAMQIARAEGGDRELIAAAVLLHDCVAVEKNSPLRAQASRLAAKKAEGILASLGWELGRIAAVTHAIEAHSFSANIEPQTLEAAILQDADRLDAIGLIGVARCFYTAGRMSSRLYSPEDPVGSDRVLDDKTFAIDHFPMKLFALAKKFRTRAGQALADARDQRLRAFYHDFLREVAHED